MTKTIEIYKPFYNELEEKKIMKVFDLESAKFTKTINNGFRILTKEMKVYDYIPGKKIEFQDLSPIEGFTVYTPPEITVNFLFDFYQKFGFPY